MVAVSRQNCSGIARGRAPPRIVDTVSGFRIRAHDEIHPAKLPVAEWSPPSSRPILGPERSGFSWLAPRLGRELLGVGAWAPTPSTTSPIGVAMQPPKDE